MDGLDLLAREDEFKKLNKQLEKKTETLMKEIEQVMQKQDIFTEFTSNVYNTNSKKHYCNTQNAATPFPIHKSFKSTKKNAQIATKKLNMEHKTQRIHQEFQNGTQNIHHIDPKCIDSCTQPTKTTIACNCCSEKASNNDMEYLYAFVSVNVKDEVFPKSFLKDGVTVENVCKFLSSKVKLMQEQIDKLKITIEKKTSQCEMHLTQLAELESQKLGLLNSTNNMKATTAEMKAKCLALQNRLDEKDKLFKEKRSESDKLSSEVKKLRSKTSSLRRGALRKRKLWKP
ncbi:testis-expressed protein 9-like [Manduca sexta]|uniref:testis-expressed protein 9-like n=1 Tax=Manduca sexta TaxID=7130 RepID=UPI00188E2D2B|nr:testis-expressed protein 9-like [Manduca sexta]